MEPSRDLYLGWDVGAWNCDRNRESRDALCALTLGKAGPEVAGSPWRGNLRSDLVEFESSRLIDALLARVGIARSREQHVTIAIDTPLAWPRRMLELVTEGTTWRVPEAADENEYLFRPQELELFKSGCRPLSPVRDMIGSQSTKGIHFLRQAGLSAREPGVWSDRAGSVTAIETYPAPVYDRSDELKARSAELLGEIVCRHDRTPPRPWVEDVGDAITCALVAWEYRTSPTELQGPGDGSDAAEGWIWLPHAAVAART